MSVHIQRYDKCVGVAIVLLLESKIVFYYADRSKDRELKVYTIYCIVCYMYVMIEENIERP